MKKELKVIMHLNRDDYDETVEETFFNKEELQMFLDDQYDNFAADDPELAEEVIYPLICDLMNDEYEEDSFGTHIYER